MRSAVSGFLDTCAFVISFALFTLACLWVVVVAWKGNLFTGS